MTKEHQIAEGFYIGNTLAEAERIAKSIGMTVYVVKTNGIPNPEIRANILRPYEVKLVLDNAGRVSSAYRII